MSTEPAPVDRVRASTAEKNAAEKILGESLAEGMLDVREYDERVAEVWKATYRDEVGHSLRELAVPASRWTAPQAQQPNPAPAGVGSTTSLAFFGGVSRKGEWAIASNHSALSAFGGIDLDLRDAAIGNSVTINAYAIFGGVDIIVPRDATVICDGVGIFGGFDNKAAAASPSPNAPTIHIRGLALFGGVDIRRAPF
ncbi:DUF1707 SHOCT-like domain-containing protein [Corynebacterium vitaeruminis]|uniref:DUF1707 domain-containing protein n=1 Tax=Corynebacterium vitaeruminis DSM 20294 TaxID=1224164 RepID=W5XXQ7_9CORY|nr:DUF1707 domain-containing protein [Corynebacterium vitaeruminis]AHI21821.1 hypothetical protein B843_02145 [Corynebacterium vitaeruminis DSM 20294]